MKTSDFYFDLPEELIAQEPLADRASSRLMVVHKDSGRREHRHFRDIKEYLRAGDCLVINNTKVLPARLYGERVGTGAAMEILLLPAVCFKLKDGEDPGYTLYDLSERLRLRGWQVPAFTLGGEATDIVVMRIMCRRGFEMDFAELLLEDYKASLKYLSDHPKLQGIAQQNSFKHT